jgi:hypothetical protein
MSQQPRGLSYYFQPRLILSAAVWLCCCLLASQPAAARPQEISSTQSSKSAVATRITSNITLDGVLDEPVWSAAPKIGDLTQREPVPGVPPTENTQVTVLYNADYLYVGVVCFDSEPQRVIGTRMERDAALSDDDSVEILLDTFHDRSNAFYFATNPAGALVDGLVFANGQSNMQWDATWEVRTRRTNQGWTAEFAVPFKSLSFPSGRTTWGFNIARNIQRKLEDLRWSGARLEVRFLQVSEAGEVTGLEEITQGIGLDIRPFIAGRWLHHGVNGDDVFTGKPGLDMFYNLTPSLKFTATANTDFGETEVDARQINLSRFSLFFPEKRTFFLEDAGVFAFSNTTATAFAGIPSHRSQIIPFFSRRIGLLSGEEVPITFGAKLTGKVGRTDVGMLDVRTRESSVAPEKNFFVGRVKRNLLQQSSIGAIFTHGNSASPLSSNTVGLDVRLATSHFLGESRNLALNVFGVKSVNEGVSGNDASYGLSVEYPNDLVEAEFLWREVQQDFQPALGFVSRRNVRLMRIDGRFSPRPKKFLGLRRVPIPISYTRFTRLDNGEVESWDVFTAPADWHFNSGDAIHINIRPMYERLFTPFEISDGVFLPLGEYRFTRYRLQGASAAKRRLEATIDWSFGSYWSGHADEIQTVLLYKIPPRFVISFTTNQTFARLPQGNFVARIMSWQVNYSASPFLTFSNLIQYDNDSRNLGWQSRMRWILHPGNDLFFVFSQGWLRDTSGGFRYTAEDSKVSAKFQYTFRF